MQNIKTSIKNFTNKTLFIAGIKCICCGEELAKDSKYSLCDSCYTSLPFITGKICKKCGEPVSSLADYCIKCKNHIDRNFTVARSMFLYDDIMRKLVINLKFNGKKYLARYLSWFMYDCYMLNDFNCDLVLPVPMHTKSLKKRGYNQQQLLCSAFELKGFNIDTTSVVKVLNTKPQVGLDFKQRQTNLTDAFKVVDKDKVKGKNILIVDDIYTTGATVSEVSKVLLKAGANSITVLTLCHEAPDKMQTD